MGKGKKEKRLRGCSGLGHIRSSNRIRGAEGGNDAARSHANKRLLPCSVILVEFGRGPRWVQVKVVGEVSSHGTSTRTFGIRLQYPILIFSFPRESMGAVDDISPISSQLPQTYIPQCVVQDRATSSSNIRLRCPEQVCT